MSDEIDRWMQELSLEEKAALISGADLWHTVAVDRLGIPAIMCSDGPHGMRAQVDQTDENDMLSAAPATCFPTASAIACSWDRELIREVGAAIADEARQYHVSVVLGPGVNMKRSPLCGRNFEYVSEDPYLAGELGLAIVEGIQSRDVGTSVKHFAANNQEHDRLRVSAEIDERTLREIYLPHFRRAVMDANVASVMSAYNRVNQLYCSESPHLLRDILKGEWEFQGFVESDWVYGTNSTVDAALAGLDIEMPYPDHFGDALVAAVVAGDVPESVIDEAGARVLRAQLCHGLDVNPPVRDESMRETPAALALAREVAERSLVLLRNEGGALPLDRDAITNLVVVGPLADLENIGDEGSSVVDPSTVVTALEGIVAAAGDVTVTHVTGDPNEGDNAAAITAADVVVAVVGLTSDDEGEALLGAGDRESLAIPAAQLELLDDVAALNDALVVVLEGGSAITMDGVLGTAPAVVMAWYPGMEGGHAIAAVLFGDVNPSGRLPIVFPADEADLPAFDNVSFEVTYGYYHGYRHLDHEGVSPSFPFGFGLSYTTYALSNLALESAALASDGVLRATVDVTNTGARAGIETVQLYVHATTSRVERAVRDLEAFAQVELEPGETKTVTLEVDAEDLAFWDAEADRFEVETTEYLVEVGPSAGELPLTAAFSIE
jgi:beta-glucosidase